MKLWYVFGYCTKSEKLVETSKKISAIPLVPSFHCLTRVISRNELISRQLIDFLANGPRCDYAASLQ
jgi:hypothetical protein